MVTIKLGNMNTQMRIRKSNQIKLIKENVKSSSIIKTRLNIETKNMKGQIYKRITTFPNSMAVLKHGRTTVT